MAGTCERLTQPRETLLPETRELVLDRDVSALS